MKTRHKLFAILLLAALTFSALGASQAQAAGTPPDSTADVVYGKADFTTNANIDATTLNGPQGVAMDGNGNLYVVDYRNNRVLYYPAGSTTATRVYGQGGSFITSDMNKNGVSANSLFGATDLVVDNSGNLYVVDLSNSRVLYYPTGSTTATRVYGQGGDFTTNTSNKGGLSADSLSYPGGIALDGSGNLYVVDSNNSRVLYYPAGSTTATRVYGQGGDFTTGDYNKGGVSADSLGNPRGVAVDSSDNLYVADYLNTRVLYYPAGSTTATRVYGQGGDFTTDTANKGGVSADSLAYPIRIDLDGSGNLYVADRNNSRVLYYPTGSTTATRVYGQGGDFTTYTANKDGLSADSLSSPNGIVVDGSGNLYMADNNNNRVLYYPVGSTSATRVYGQGGSFTSDNDTLVDAGHIAYPTGVAADGSGNLYVVDSSNNRVLYYPAGSTATTRVYGQGGDFTTANYNKGGVSADSLAFPQGVAVDSSGNLYVADYENCRVLYYPAGSTTATRVYGQGGDFTTGDYNKGGVSADSLGSASGIAVDGSGNLYVVDNDNSRVLYYPAGSTTATRVYGQGGDFTTGIMNKGGLSADSLAYPEGVALDSSGNLYVADRSNIRVLYYPAGSTTATRVYGQGGDFTTNNENKGGLGPDSLAAPYGVVVDGSGNLYVTDEASHRALFYPAGSTTATAVYGQGGDFTTDTLNKGGLSADSLMYPKGLGVDGSGNLYVADSINNRVLKYDSPDTTAPSLKAFARQSPAASPTSADSLVFRATFSEDVQNVDITDFAVNGTTTATITTVTPVSASVYDLTVSGGNLPSLNGIVGLDLAAGQNITDLAGNPLPAGEPATDEAYTVITPLERLKNGGLELFAKPTTPKYWTTAKFGLTDGKSTVKKVGKFAVQIVGQAKVTKTMSQTVTVSGGVGDPFSFSVWAKGSKLSKTGTCQVQVLLYNGATLAQTQTAKCPVATFAWRQIKIDFTALKPYTKAVVKFTFKKTGTVWFDAASLKR